MRIAAARHERMTRGRLARGGLWALLALAVVYWVVAAVLAIVFVPEPTGYSDFAMYFAAALGLREGAGPTIYSSATLARVAAAHGSCTSAPILAYVYPPLLSVLLLPFTALPCVAAAHLWRLLNVLLWAATALIVTLHLHRRWPRQKLLATTIIVIASGCSWLLLFNLMIGQVVFIVLCSLVLSAWLVERERPALAGVVLAVAALVKVVPALIILYYLLRGRWRVVAGALAGAAVLTAVMVVFAGWSTVLASLPAALSAGVRYARPPGDDAVSVMFPGFGAGISILGGFLFAAALWWARGRGDEWLGHGWAVCTMLLVSPLVWWLYLPWLLTAFAACLGAVRPRAWPLLLVLCAVVIPEVLPLPAVIRSLDIVAWWLTTGLFFVRSVVSPMERPMQRPADQPAPSTVPEVFSRSSSLSPDEVGARPSSVQ